MIDEIKEEELDERKHQTIEHSSTTKNTNQRLGGFANLIDSKRNINENKRVDTMPDTDIHVGKYDVDSMRTPKEKMTSNTIIINTSNNQMRKKNIRNISGLISFAK